MKILDLSAGHRAVWFDRQCSYATYVDIRPEVNPDIVADSRDLPTTVGRDYDVIVFDPPHDRFGANSDMAKDYGSFSKQHILDTVQGTAREAQYPSQARSWDSSGATAPSNSPPSSGSWSHTGSPYSGRRPPTRTRAPTEHTGSC